MIQRQLTQFASVLEDAQKQYAELKGQELTDFMKPPMKSVEDMLAVINRQNDMFDNFRARSELFLALDLVLFIKTDRLTLVPGQKLFHAMSTALVPLEVCRLCHIDTRPTLLANTSTGCR